MDAVVALRVGGGVLLDGEGDEEAEFGDLAGDGLDVGAEDGVLDEVEFAAEVGVVVRLEDGADVVEAGVAVSADGEVEGGGGLLAREFALERLPARVLRIEAPEGEGEFVEGAHREGAGADGGVEDAELGDGADEAVGFIVGEHFRGVGVVEEVADALAPELAVAVAGGGFLRERFRQRLVDHIVHDLAGRVVGAGLLAGVLAGFGVVGGEEVLEDLAEQFRVERDVLLDGRVLLDGELVAVEEPDEAAVAEEEAVGNGVAVALGGVVGEAVDAVAAGAVRLLAVEAVEEAAVDDGRLLEEVEERVGVGHFVAVAVAREVAVRPVGLGAEAALGDFRVEGCEEEVLEDGAVVGVAGGAVVVLEERGDLRLREEFGGDQALLLDEPDEEEARDEADDVLLRTEGFRAGGWELGLVAGALEPSEEFPVEALVEFLGVEGGEPCVKESVEVGEFAVVAHPSRAGVERQVREDVEVGAVRVPGVDLADEGDGADDVVLGAPPVGAAVDEGEREEPVGVAEEDDGGNVEPLVDLAGEVGVLAALVGAAVEFDGQEEETAGDALVEGVVLDEAALQPLADVEVGDLKEDADGRGGLAERALGVRVGV